MSSLLFYSILFIIGILAITLIFVVDTGDLFADDKQKVAETAAAKNDPYYKTKKIKKLFNGEVPWREQLPTLEEFDLPVDYADIIKVEKRRTIIVEIFFSIVGFLLLIAFSRLFVLRGTTAVWWFLGLLVFSAVGVVGFFAISKLAKGENISKRYDEFVRAQKAYDYWRDMETISYWNSLDPYQFEHEVAAVFRKSGYDAEVTKGSGDGGVDIVLDDGCDRIAVQCKAHNHTLPLGTVRDLYGTMIDGNYARAILVSKSGFTNGFYEFVKDKPIELLSLNDILEMVKKQ